MIDEVLRQIELERQRIYKNYVDELVSNLLVERKTSDEKVQEDLKEYIGELVKKEVASNLSILLEERNTSDEKVQEDIQEQEQENKVFIENKFLGTFDYILLNNPTHNHPQPNNPTQKLYNADKDVVFMPILPKTPLRRHWAWLPTNIKLGPSVNDTVFGKTIYDGENIISGKKIYYIPTGNTDGILYKWFVPK